jgi:hypothetical protein
MVNKKKKKKKERNRRLRGAARTHGLPDARLECYPEATTTGNYNNW